MNFVAYREKEDRTSTALLAADRQTSFNISIMTKQFSRDTQFLIVLSCTKFSYKYYDELQCFFNKLKIPFN